MKTKFNNGQLAHVWAQQNQPEGSGSSFFFRGPSIYSYGNHFEIARFVTRKGARCVLFTTRTYSVTTAKHIGHARNALHGHALPVFRVPDIDHAARGGSATRDAYRARTHDAMQSAGKARKPDNAIREIERAQRIAAEANEYSAFFGQRWHIAVPANTPELLDALREKAVVDSAKLRAATKARKAREETEYQEALAEWRAGARASLPFNYARPVALRVVENVNAPATIQTSRGAEVPARVAPMLWPMIEECRLTCQAWSAGVGNRPRLGSFTLDAIDAAGNVTAGCHVLPYSELRMLAVRFGFEVAP